MNDDWFERLVEEHEDLKGRLEKLNAFLQPGGHPAGIHEYQIFLMLKQRHLMTTLERVLGQRICQEEVRRIIK